MGADIRQGISTLPLLYASLPSNTEDALILKNLNESVDEVLQRVLSHPNAISWSRQLAQFYCTGAKQALSRLPSSESRRLLEELADSMVMRQI